MAKLSQEDLNKIKAELREQAELQQKINESAGDYLKLMKELKNLNIAITETKKRQNEIDKKLKEANKAYLDELSKGAKASDKILKQLKLSRDIEKEKLKLISHELDYIEKMTAELVKQVKEANKFHAVFSNVKKDIGIISNTIKFGYGKLKNWAGAFDMDKAIRMSALQMGVLNKQSDSFRTSIELAANQTASFGVGMAELAKLQSDYSEELGRSVILGKEGLVTMGELAKATGLGAEGTAKMAADLENQGYSAERTRDFIEQTMNDAHKLGLNASKVIRNIQSNIKLLNKFNFKNGVKGLAKMAETTAKLGIEMNSIVGMSEKLFDIEGAVDMSAQLQVLGGEWAKLADPFKLMYMARNDMEGLTEAIGKAAESSIHFNKTNGEFEISALEMHRLRKVAEQTGLAYEDLAQAGKNAAKFTQIKQQLKFSVDKQTQEFLSTTAKFNENGEAYIEIEGSKKLVKQLSNGDKALLKAQIAEKATARERAESSQTFDEKMTNIIKQLKQFLLPLVVEMDKGLRPILQNLTNTFRNPEVVKSIREAAATAGKAIVTIGKFVANNPLTSLISIGLFEAGKWYMNGRILGMGFNSVASVGGSPTSGGGFGSGLKGMRTGAKMIGNGKVLGGLGTFTKGLGKAAVPLALLGAGIDGVTNALDDNLTITEKFFKTLDQHKGMAAGAAIGSIVPVIGTAVGAGIGGIVDMFTPEFGSYGKNRGQHDAIFNRPINDGFLGNDFSKGRGIIQGGKITPIDNKDDLIAYKPNGPIDNSLKNNTPSVMKIEFGEIHFKFDELKVTSPGSPGLAIDLLKDPQFTRNVTRMVHVETEKIINGGKSKG